MSRAALTSQPRGRGYVMSDVEASGPVLRPARITDCRRIAELFRISSEGVADYVWSRMQDEFQGLSLLEIGERRYRREGTAFSYQNCLVAEKAGEVIGMVHSFVIEPELEAPEPAQPVDPVLRPYAELEVPGSLYVAGLALLPEHCNRGIGRRLLAAARERAREAGAGELSLLCLESNAGAFRLYEREGFRTIDRRPIVPHPMIHAAGDVLLMVAPA
jgi:ribosomal protein S18 acetylase RimI-like enzyme